MVDGDGAPKMAVQYELRPGQTRLFHELPSGLSMEVIAQESDSKSGGDLNPPLVFVHGSYHAAWCWAEHWLPFFSSHGFDCYAVSLLGQGESDAPSAPVAGSLQTHAADIADFIDKKLSSPPVLIGHSFGGLFVQHYIANMRNKQSTERDGLFPDVEGAVLLCSVPPSGNRGMAWRFLFTKPIAIYKAIRSMAFKGFQTSLPLCKETFFSAAMEDHLVQRYQELLKGSSRMRVIDVWQMNASLPAPVPKSSVQILVVGANDDFLLDAQAIRETAEYYGVPPICVEGVAHDMMLDCSWEKGADVILSWLEGLRKDQR
ncbi:hypothetical protein ACJRO7_029117 [Eucalyptus globulus]|uniref:AB hydrolase-1 domain-containing protein n=1 Tax=Eucalyptus globulus TaxID=34317 RepID=A0ABD3K1Y5_EUCGL